MDTPLSRLKIMASMLGRSMDSLTVLARQNDCFRIGTPTQVAQAEWFAAIWEREQFPPGTHVRRIHYRLVSKAIDCMADGEPYVNTEHCWHYIQKVSKFARALGLVDARMFADRRNPSPHLYMGTEPAAPRLELERPGISLPHIDADISTAWLSLRAPQLFDFEYRDSDQPYLVEVWVEKSTLDDELVPLCRRLNVNLVTSKGFASHTAAVNMIDRCLEHNKPGRILYISDFDPAGDDMPSAVARQLEFRRDEYPDLDITLEPLMMTPEIAAQYSLPRTPVSDKVNAKQRFEAFHGEGGVELDALEALHPGETEKIVAKAIQQYRDHGIRKQIIDAGDVAETALSEQWQEEIQPLRDEWQAIQQSATHIADRYRTRLRLLSERMEREMAPHQELADELWEKANIVVDEFDFEIPERPLSDGNVAGNSIDHYFDSSRDYLSQLEYHRRRKGR